jgi:hypothetical protein
MYASEGRSVWCKGTVLYKDMWINLFALKSAVGARKATVFIFGEEAGLTVAVLE